MWSMSGLEIFVWEEKNMYELKTKPTNISPHNVIAAIPHPQKREDAGRLLEILRVPQVKNRWCGERN